MEEEKFFSGFCRQADGVRTVSLEYEDRGKRVLLSVDCGFLRCVHRSACEIGKAICAFLEETETEA